MQGNKITALADPTTAQDAATKAYVDLQVATVPANPSLATRLKWEALLR